METRTVFGLQLNQKRNDAVINSDMMKNVVTARKEVCHYCPANFASIKSKNVSTVFQQKSHYMFHLLRTKPTFSLSLMKLVGRRDKHFHVMDLHWTLIDRLKECNFCSLSAEQGSYTRSDCGHYNTKVHPVKFCVLRQVWPGKIVLDS